MSKDKDKSSLPRLDEMGVFHFCKDVDSASIKEAVEFVLRHNFMDEPLEHLTMIVSSFGGDLEPCFALIDVMEGSRIPIHTVGLGMIDSCGLLIFMTGQRGSRTLTPNTEVLSHQYSGGSLGKHHELIQSQFRNELTMGRMMRHYRKHTKLKEQEIKKWLLPPHDVWLTAKEAKRFGICDHIGLV